MSLTLWILHLVVLIFHLPLVLKSAILELCFQLITKALVELLTNSKFNISTHTLRFIYYAFQNGIAISSLPFHFSNFLLPKKAPQYWSFSCYINIY